MSFTTAEIEVLDRAATAVFEMFDKAGDWLAGHPEMLSRMGIPEWAHKAVIDSWWRQDPDTEEYFASVFGRFDFSFGGLDHQDPSYRTPKLLEYNADTPTTLPESAISQWHWHTATDTGKDQWNSIFEDLIAAWRRNLRHIEKILGRKPIVYFACQGDLPTDEDLINTTLMRDTCAAAGYETRFIYMEDIGLGDDGKFYDFSPASLDSAGVGPHDEGTVIEATLRPDQHLDVVFKLYPWEYILEEEFGKAVFADMARLPRFTDGNYQGGTFWVEPPYKLMWSNKAILAVLWHLFKDTEAGQMYLLPAYFEDEKPPDMHTYVRKALLGREGANVTFIQDGQVTTATDGDYDDSGYIVQGLHPLPVHYDGPSELPMHVMTGVWMIDGKPAGMCLRECASPITNNTAYFLPHAIED